jgi:FKBP-type peptidyl-prolyl cis-trans isomerase SlyD
VWVDQNHPLSDVTLHFDVEVVSIRDATAEEVAHGHPHMPGHHHH